ncbi:MAG: hypothetical protein P1V97_14320 [Planctomycetota bacterium]|nr:hypothetical protein [Planctomycetota bacterium]
MPANSIILMTSILFALTVFPCAAQDKAPVKVKKSAQQKQATLEKAWLKVFEKVRKSHEEGFKKARKVDLPLKGLRDQWLKALISEEKRAFAEMNASASTLKVIAAKQHQKVRFERLRLLLSVKQVKSAQGLLRELLKQTETRNAARRLQIAFARRDNPGRLPEIYQDILSAAGPKFPTLADPNFQLPPKKKEITLVWIWSKGHPFARHNLPEYLRALQSHGGQVIALALTRSTKSKNKPIPGVIERCIQDSKDQTREALCLSSNPLLLLINKNGELVLVDPTAKELDQWFRQRKKGS